MNILIIKDDKPGHYNQTEGLLLSLKTLYPHAKIEYIVVAIRSKLSRKILRLFINYYPSFFKSFSHTKYLHYFYRLFGLPQNKPDIIISTGGNTAALNAWFALLYNSKNILNGALRGLKEERFTCITTVIDLGYTNQVILEMAPNTITEQTLEDQKNLFLKKTSLSVNQTYFTLLIGGDGSGYIYNESFYRMLASFVETTAQKYNVKWLITTSRRTPKDIEEKLAKKLEPVSAYFVAYHQNSEKVLLPFLALGSSIFVTEESSSMISEAISANKPVYTFKTSSATPDENYQEILNKFFSSKKLYRLDLNENNALPPLSSYFNLTQSAYHLMLSKQLAPFVKINLKS